MKWDYSYIQRFWSIPFEGFDTEEAINNVGVTIDDFCYGITDKKGKLMVHNIDNIDALYTFVLFYYYRLFAHNIEVFNLPELFNYCDLRQNDIRFEKIILSGMRKGAQKATQIHLIKGNDDIVLEKLISATQDLPSFVKLETLLRDKAPEIRNGKDFLNKRQIGYTLAIKLSHLYQCLLDSPHTIRLYSYSNLDADSKKEIAIILKAFGLFRANPTDDDYRLLEYLYKVQPIYSKGLFYDRKYAYGRLANQFIMLPKDLHQIIMF